MRAFLSRGSFPCSRKTEHWWLDTSVQGWIQTYVECEKNNEQRKTRYRLLLMLCLRAAVISHLKTASLCFSASCGDLISKEEEWRPSFLIHVNIRTHYSNIFALLLHFKIILLKAAAEAVLGAGR